MIDKDVLFLCAESVDNFRRYRKFIKPHVLEKETNIILGYMEEFYESRPSEKKVEWSSFRDRKSTRLNSSH